MPLPRSTSLPVQLTLYDHVLVLLFMLFLLHSVYMRPPRTPPQPSSVHYTHTYARTPAHPLMVVVLLLLRRDVSAAVQ